MGSDEDQDLLEEIKHQQERLDRLEEENRKLKEKISKITGEKDSEQTQEETGIDRRAFLKKLGAGVVGFGALSLAPAASKVTISSDGITQNGNSFWTENDILQQDYLKADGSAPLTGSLNLNGNDIQDNTTTIWDASNGYIPTSAIQSVSSSDLAFDPATQTELDNHAGNSSAHHTKYTDSDAQNVVNSTDSGNVLGGDSYYSNEVAIHSSASTGEGGSYNIAIGKSAFTGPNTTNGVAVGRNANVGGSDSANAVNDGIAIGNGATATQFNDNNVGSVAIGNDAEAAGGALAIGGGWGVSATADKSVAIGAGASASNDYQGVLGNSGDYDTKSWVVPGDFTVNGSKNFEIDHPVKPETHDLRHGVYEGDVAGGLIYRREVTIQMDGDTGTETVQMPEWFGPLATDVDVVVQPQGHFGRAYAECEEPNGRTIEVTANQSGDYKLVVFATRDDSNVPDPEDHEVVKPKGMRWNGDPRSYHRDAPDVDVDRFEEVGRIEQFFEHDDSDAGVPVESAFQNWRVTFDDGERVEVDEPLSTSVEEVVSIARDNRE